MALTFDMPRSNPDMYSCCAKIFHRYPQFFQVDTSLVTYNEYLPHQYEFTIHGNLLRKLEIFYYTETPINSR
jgi:hypothetical protein